MGSYGIGVSRLVGALIEAFHDEKGIVWPESVAPFRIGLVNLRPDDAATTALAEELYAPAARAGRRGADGRPRRAGGRQVRDHGADRAALAGRRSARAALPRTGSSCKNRATGEKQDISPVMLVERFAP